jgi:hypothetical protein
VTTADTKKLFAKLSKEPFEKCELAWQEVLQLLRLPPKFVPAIQVILKQGGWRKQPNPAAYIRKAAVRCAVRQQVIDPPVRHSAREVLASDLSYRDLDGELLPHDERLDMASTEYERRFGSYHDEGDYRRPIDRVSRALIKDGKTIWSRVADLAGLDPGERIVLELQSRLHLGREQALAMCLTDSDRRILQAAWKRLERHRKTVKKVLLSGESHKSRRINSKEHIWEVQLMFIQTSDGGVKFSLAKLVPNGET